MYTITVMFDTDEPAYAEALKDLITRMAPFIVDNVEAEMTLWEGGSAVNVPPWPTRPSVIQSKNPF